MEIIKRIFKFVLGFGILFGFYWIACIIVNKFKLIIPPSVLGLIFFATCLYFGFIKEDWVESSANFMLKNMAILFVPFIVGLISYKELLCKNCFVILLVIFIATAATIVATGLFVEYGIKYLRLHKMRKFDD